MSEREQTIEKITSDYHLPGPSNFREALRRAYDAGCAAQAQKAPELRPVAEALELYFQSHMRKEDADRAIFALRACLKNREELREQFAEQGGEAEQ